MNNALYAIALFAATANAAATFGPVKNYPNMGFMFPCLANAKADPVPMPQAHTFLLVAGDDLTREDRFDPFELWYANQCCARWYDALGDQLVIGRMTRQLPSFGEDNVSREQFADALNDDANLISPEKPDEVNEWVATFVDATVYKPTAVKLNAFSLDDVRFFPCDATNLLIYAFRPRRTGNAKEYDWFCVTFQASGENGPQALRELFEEQFLSRIALPNRASEDEGVQSEEVRAQPKGEKLPPPSNQPACVEARKSIENYDTWWSAEAEGYTILSDVHTDIGKSVIRDLQETLPALRKAFAKLVPPIAHDNDASLIRLFQSRDDYVRYVGKEQAWTGGVWIPGRRELVLTQGTDKAEMMRIIRHESFHQYLSYAYATIPPAPWMNEGHACFFENARVDSKKKITIDEDPARCPLLVENIELAVALLPQVLQADYPTFYSGNATERSLKYAVAWGLAYYLQKGAPLERNTPFRSILQDHAAALAQTRSYSEATQQAFSQIDMPVFQDNFREFWLKRRATAIQYDPLEAQ